MKKTQEQFTVICDGLFLNDTKPEKWEQTFAWTPSVGFHFRSLDESGEPTGEVQKKYLKNIWLWQAMGGKNASGKYFRLEAEHGMLPAKDGKPEKPYVTITPLAEVFSDGTARFLEAPKDGKVNVPASTDKPKGPVTPPASKPPAPKSAAAPPPEDHQQVPVKKIDPNTAKAASFFDDFMTPQTDAWWTAKNHLNYDGADASNLLEFSKNLAVAENCNGPEEGYRERMEAAIDYWTLSMRPRLLRMKYENTFQRLAHYLGLCQTVKQVDKVIAKAWTELPESLFLALRAAAVDRVRTIQADTVDGVFMGKIKGTLQPEVPGGVKAPAPPIVVEEEEEKAPAAPALEPGVIEYTESAMLKYEDLGKLVNFWNEGSQAIKEVERLRLFLQVRIIQIVKKMESQGDIHIGNFLDTLPAYIKHDNFMLELHQAYNALIPF